MNQLNENEIEMISGGGAMQTIGTWLGNAAGELQAHPEAMLLGPTAAVYILLKCDK